MAWNPNIPAVTNRVQDDLDAIRQNFEALDGLPQDKTNILELAGEKNNILGHLADTNNPHNVQAQQVPYSSGVVGFSPADVKAALDALAGVRIVEMGSNSNGEYVRWENGLQVCFTRLNTSASQDTLWTLPAAFIDSEWVFSSGVGATFNDGAQVVTFQGRTTNSVSLRVLNASGARVPGSAFIIAIGRWK